MWESVTTGSTGVTGCRTRIFASSSPSHPLTPAQLEHMTLSLVAGDACGTHACNTWQCSTTATVQRSDGSHDSIQHSDSEVYLHKHVARFFVQLHRLHICALAIQLIGQLKFDVCCLHIRGRKRREAYKSHISPRQRCCSYNFFLTTGVAAAAATTALFNHLAQQIQVYSGRAEGKSFTDHTTQT